MAEGDPAVADGAGATRALAERIVRAQPPEASEAVWAEARRTLLNYAGCAVGGGGHDTVERIVRAFADAGRSDTARLFGRRERTDPFQAALLNGVASNVHGFDDTHLETVIHPAGPVAAALFALADAQAAKGRPVGGRAFQTALILGVEVECRMGLAAGPAPYAAGWHATGVYGVFGAAAAAGRLLELDAGRMTHALGMAATEAIGMRQAFGSMTVSLHVGLAARAGLSAALLAREGFTASEHGLEGSAGWARLVAPDLDVALLTRPFGPAWEILANTYKPYASGVVTHPAMEAAIRLSVDHDLRPEQVARVEINAHPLVGELTGRMQPATALQSKVSIGHAVAVALATRQGGPRQFEDAAVRDPAVVALRNRIRLRADSTCGRAEARLTLSTTEGRELTHHVPDALGSRGRPMSDDDLDAKVHVLADPVLGVEGARRLVTRCRRVEDLADMSEVSQAAHDRVSTTRSVIAPAVGPDRTGR